MLSWKTLLKGHLILWVEALIVNHQPAKFAGHRDCVSEDMNISENVVILLLMGDPTFIGYL